MRQPHKLLELRALQRPEPSSPHQVLAEPSVVGHLAGALVRLGETGSGMQTARSGKFTWT